MTFNQVEFEQTFTAFEQAKSMRASWENLWQDCYDMALPQRGVHDFNGLPSRKNERLFDGTALDGVDQLAASIMGNLTPNFTPWFGVKCGVDCTDEDKAILSPVLERSTKILHTHLSRSNFIVAFHQSVLDLVVAGTASLAVEEERIGAYTAFRFVPIPLHQIVLGEGVDGRLNKTCRVLSLTKAEIESRYAIPDLADIESSLRFKREDEQYEILESVEPFGTQFIMRAMVIDDNALRAPLIQKVINYSPYINFRWMKSPSEIYGRSPVMKALPDIKTVNKVVELILKNASIAVTGIWQADDDGVINPANIQLTPGAIIPKAVGSKGLTPLEMPGRFDVSQLILDDLRNRIRHALLVDRLPQLDARKMTATEIIERASEMNLLLGATYGRLQTELLDPLIMRLYDILRRRGEIADLPLDGRVVEIEYRSPLARSQSVNFAKDMMAFLNDVKALGAEAVGAINIEKTVRYLADIVGVPNDIVREQFETTPVIKSA